MSEADGTAAALLSVPATGSLYVSEPVCCSVSLPPLLTPVEDCPGMTAARTSSTLRITALIDLYFAFFIR